jgi:hypothetical protein
MLEVQHRTSRLERLEVSYALPLEMLVRSSVLLHAMDLLMRQ